MTGSQADWRELTLDERALLAEALSGDWPGAAELRTQLPGALARPGCSCGCGTIDLCARRGAPAMDAPSPTPHEGVVLDADGVEVGGLLLFLERGLLQSLEIYAYEGPRPMPPPERVRWEVVRR